LRCLPPSPAAIRPITSSASRAIRYEDFTHLGLTSQTVATKFERKTRYMYDKSVQARNIAVHCPSFRMVYDVVTRYCATSTNKKDIEYWKMLFEITTGYPLTAVTEEVLALHEHTLIINDDDSLDTIARSNNE